MRKLKRLSRGYHGLMTLFLYDEAPNIGCGLRVVTVRIGNKRVKLRDAFTLKEKIIPRATFDMIERRGSEKAVRNG
jgi:hypothetical protein